MGFENDWLNGVMESLGDAFTLHDLEKSMKRASRESGPLSREVQRTTECVRWLAEINYEVHFPRRSPSPSASFPGLLEREQRHGGRAFRALCG